MGFAFGFVASKEVVVAPWFKKPDVELIDPSGEMLTVYSFFSNLFWFLFDATLAFVLQLQGSVSCTFSQSFPCPTERQKHFWM